MSAAQGHFFPLCLVCSMGMVESRLRARPPCMPSGEMAVWRPSTHPPTHNSCTSPAPAPAGIILYAMVYGYYPFNPADPKLPKKMMEASAGAVG